MPEKIFFNNEKTRKDTKIFIGVAAWTDGFVLAKLSCMA
jgi:hypothetical protein